MIERIIVLRFFFMFGTDRFEVLTLSNLVTNVSSGTLPGGIQKVPEVLSAKDIVTDDRSE